MGSYRLDELDIFILKNILTKETTTTWQLAKKYKWDKVPVFFTNAQEEDFYSRKTSTISWKLNKVLSEMGLVNIVKEINKGRTTNIYEVIADRVLIKKHKFVDGYHDALHVKDKSNKWLIIQL